MDYRNATRNQNGTVDVEINHPVFGWIPFTASPDDPEPFGRAVYREIKDTATIILAPQQPL